MSNKIHFIITGGTLDKEYNRVQETPIMRTETVIPEFLQKTIEANFEYTTDTVCMIDSLEMTDTHRQTILDAINNTDARNIVITHGTSTMENTAKFLDKHLSPDHGKTIAITGAMEPLYFHNSDGAFNLGAAITVAQNMLPGLYICMHGQTYKPGKVKKNTQTAHFEET